MNMKKIMLLTSIALLGILSVFAQQDDGVRNRHRKANVVKLGPKLGATFSTMSQPDEIKLADGSGTGFALGATVKTRLGYATEETMLGGTGLVGFGLELNYKQTKMKTVGERDIALAYFEIPVLAQIFPLLRSNAMNSFFIEVGPDFALLLSKEPDVLHVPSANVNYHIGDLKGGDLRLLIGMGYTVPKTSLDINLRYYFGTSDLAKNLPCKVNTLEITAAWMFNIAKY